MQFGDFLKLRNHSLPCDVTRVFLVRCRDFCSNLHLPKWHSLAIDQKRQSRTIFKISWNRRWCWCKWWNFGCWYQMPLVQNPKIADLFLLSKFKWKELLLNKGEWRMIMFWTLILKNTNHSLNVKCCLTATRENIRREIVVKISLSLQCLSACLSCHTYHEA